MFYWLPITYVIIDDDKKRGLQEPAVEQAEPPTLERRPEHRPDHEAPISRNDGDPIHTWWMHLAGITPEVQLMAKKKTNR